MNDLNLIDPTISRLNETALANILLCGDSKKSTLEKRKNLQRPIKYIIATKHIYIYIYMLVASWAYN